MSSRPELDFIRLLAGMASALREHRIPFMLIGGQAARGVTRRKGEQLDWEYLRMWAGEFASVAGREDLPDQVEALRGTARRKGK